MLKEGKILDIGIVLGSNKIKKKNDNLHRSNNKKTYTYVVKKKKASSCIYHTL